MTRAGASKPDETKKKTSATAKAKPPKVAFPRKSHPPTDGEFAARLPLPVGKRFESLRAFLKKQPGITEELYYFGPRTGWAYRYRTAPGQSLCSIAIHGQGLVGILALDPAVQAAVAWQTLSPAGQKARKLAHGTPALLWLDVPFDGPGATDFKTIVKAKLRGLAAAGGV
jgi:hypothetical protein